MTRAALALGLLPLLVSVPTASAAQAYCEDGARLLSPASPQSVAVPEIIKRFIAKESAFEEAAGSYTHTEEIVVQTLDGREVTDEYKADFDIDIDKGGNRSVIPRTLRRSKLIGAAVSADDVSDMRDLFSFRLTHSEAPNYAIHYVGSQRLDEVDTYVFDVAPKRLEARRRYFQGRVWVENSDFQIVKTCGRAVPEASPDAPRLVTYREQIDGRYWFPTYAFAEGALHASGGDVRVREQIRASNYRRHEAPATNPR